MVVGSSNTSYHQRWVHRSGSGWPECLLRTLYRNQVLKEGRVPLSEHEQRMLEQIENALYAEDPKFASNVRSRRYRG